MAGTIRHLLLGALATATIAGGLAGCADSMLAGAGDMGVTPGGSQDIGLARSIIEQGGIPRAEHFTAEGLLSEHDLPLSGEPCEELLCPRAAAAWVDPVGPMEPRMLVQLGFGTNVDPDTFERRPLELGIATDISGSMCGDKIQATRDALGTLVDQLDENDHMTLVAFDDKAELRRARTAMDAAGRQSMHTAVGNLECRGSTDIESGLALAYDEVAPHAGAAGVEDRVMLLTDAQPNTGSTDMGSFLGLARYYGAAGIGISVFGVGLDLGSELAAEISEVRGGNYFYLADIDAIRTVFDDEFDYMVTPVAYDLEVQVAAEDGLQFAEAFGAPLDQAGPQVDFGASTLFLSARAGGMGVMLSATEGDLEDLVAPADLAGFALTYLPVDAAQPVTDELGVAWAGGAEIGQLDTLADDLGVYKMAVLIDEYLALLSGHDFCSGTLPQDGALAIIGEASDRLYEVSESLDDQPLRVEVVLMDALWENVTQGSTACWPEDAYLY